MTSRWDVPRQAASKISIYESDCLVFVDQGPVSSTASNALSQCNRKLPVDNGVLPTKLYCTNRDVDDENSAELAKLHAVPPSE